MSHLYNHILLILRHQRLGVAVILIPILLLNFIDDFPLTLFAHFHRTSLVSCGGVSRHRGEGVWSGRAKLFASVVC